MLCVRRYRLIFDDGVVGFVNRCLPRFIIKLALVSRASQNRGCTYIVRGAQMKPAKAVP